MGKEFSEEIFIKFTNFIREKFGIKIGKDKKGMFEVRLKKVMQKYNIEDYDTLYSEIVSNINTNLVRDFLNEITINKTDFFREINHFNFIQNKMDFILKNNKTINNNREIRVWSSACSTGEEPYSIAISLKEVLDNSINIKILATDISEKALKVGIKGEYEKDSLSMMSSYYIQKYFHFYNGKYAINDDIKRIVTFRLFNLMNDFPFKNKFDIIFCRNVMIYFDTKTQENLIDKFYLVLNNGGLLFIGHSESLSYREHRFKYIQPTIYMK